MLLRTKPLVIIFLWSQTSFAEATNPYVSCVGNPEIQAQRSRELQEIVKADQADRATGSIDSEVLLRDQRRRMRVGAIFGEGCFVSAADYAAAALVYQHGNIADHFFQTFLWAKRAVDLGDVSQKWLMAAGIDRYLVNTERKQLFATQFWAKSYADCWCMNQVESSFPESLRVEFTGKTLDASMNSLDEFNKGKQCPKAQCTEPSAKPSPRGTVPGFW